MGNVTSDELLMRARAEVETLGVEEAKRLHATQEAAFVDVRDADERRIKGVIPGSVHASRGMLEFYLDRGSGYFLPVFAGAKPVVFVCGSGGRATLAAATAKSMGIKGKVLEGGMKGWAAAGGSLGSAD